MRAEETTMVEALGISHHNMELSFLNRDLYSKGMYLFLRHTYESNEGKYRWAIFLAKLEPTSEEPIVILSVMRENSLNAYNIFAETFRTRWFIEKMLKLSHDGVIPHTEEI